MIRLHHVPESRSMRVLWLLHELGLPFEVIEWPFDKTLRSPEFLALNPVGRVPALELNGRNLFESGAMLEILCEGFDTMGMWRPIGDAERADWLVWVHFAETISQHSAALTQQHIALYDDAMRSPTVMQIEAKRIAKCYGAMEQVLSQQDYLLSDFSAADIAVGQAVYMAKHFAPLDEFAGVTAWWERITERAGYKASLPEGPRLYAKDFYPAWT